MNQHQQQQLKKNIANNERVVQLCHAEMTANRGLRSQAIQTAMAIHSGKTVADEELKRRVPLEVNTEQMLADAEKIFMFYQKDGKLSDLSEEPTVKLIS